jgi:hypothetical protein
VLNGEISFKIGDDLKSAAPADAPSCRAAFRMWSTGSVCDRFRRAAVPSLAAAVDDPLAYLKDAMGQAIVAQMRPQNIG